MASQPIGDRERIRGVGATITLADGRDYTIRFGLNEICEIEREFGSLAEFTDQVNAPTAGPFVSFLRRTLAIVLADQDVTHDTLADLFDLHRRYEYRSAIIAAYNEGMSPPDGSGKASAETNSSRGETSTTPPPSDSAAPTSSSGE